MHELAIPNKSPPQQTSEHTSPLIVSGAIQPADVGPAIVIPKDGREEENQIERLRAQKAAIARERERKEEIYAMRAEEERLEAVIEQLEYVRQGMLS